MSKKTLFFFSVTCFVVALTITPVMGGQIVNGDFETDTGGIFDSWDYYGGSGAASVVSAIYDNAGTQSAQIKAGVGLISQDISIGGQGLSDFTWEADFTIPTANSFSGDRSVHFATYATDPSSNPYTATNIASMRVAPDKKLWVYGMATSTSTTRTWFGTDLWMSDTLINHFKVTESGLGTDNPTTTIEYSRYNADGSIALAPVTRTYYSCYVTANEAPKYFSILGVVSEGDFAVDNVSVTAAAVPEPSTLLLLLCGGLGVATFTWRKRKA